MKKLVILSVLWGALSCVSVFGQALGTATRIRTVSPAPSGACSPEGSVRVNGSGLYLCGGGTWGVVGGGGSGTGDVTGPASATDNAIARFDGTTGKLIQNSGASIDDSGNLTAVSLKASGLTSGRIPLVGSGGLLQDDDGYKYAINTGTTPDTYRLLIGNKASGADLLSASIDLYGYGVTADNAIRLVRFEGTPTAPTSVTSGNSLGSVQWLGRNTALSATGIAAVINVKASENFGTNTGGTVMEFDVTRTGVSGGTGSQTGVIQLSIANNDNRLLLFNDAATGYTKGGFRWNNSLQSLQFTNNGATWNDISAGGSPGGSNGDYQINNSGSFGAGILNQTSGRLTATPTALSSGGTSAFRWLTAADTGMTASTESIGFQYGGNTSAATVTRTWATGALTTQREHVFVAPTYAFAGASTVTTAATVAITGAPVAGTNATITNPYSLWVQGGDVALDGTQLKLTNSSAYIRWGTEITLQRYAVGSLSLTGSMAVSNQLTVGSTTVLGGPLVTIRSPAASVIPLQIEGAASNTAAVLVSKSGSSGTGNLIEAQNSSGTVLAAITSNGAIQAQNAAGTAYARLAYSGTAARLEAAGGVSWAISAQTGVGISPQGTLSQYFTSAALNQISTSQLTWNSSVNDASLGGDTGLKRAAPKIVQPTDGSSGAGWFRLAGIATPTQSDGDFYNDSSINAFTAVSGNLRGAVNSTTATSSGTKTVTATTDTSLVQLSLWSATSIPANYLTTNKQIIVEGGGFYSTGGAVTTPTVKLKLGSTTVVTGTNTLLSSGIGNYPFRFRLTLVTISTGATGTVHVHGSVDWLDSSGIWYATPVVTTAAQTIDTTTAQAVDVTLAWSNSGNSATLTGLRITN